MKFYLLAVFALVLASSNALPRRNEGVTNNNNKLQTLVAEVLRKEKIHEGSPEYNAFLTEFKITSKAADFNLQEVFNDGTLLLSKIENSKKFTQQFQQLMALYLVRVSQEFQRTENRFKPDNLVETAIVINNSWLQINQLWAYDMYGFQSLVQELAPSVAMDFIAILEKSRADFENSWVPLMELIAPYVPKPEK